jgi:Bacterial Ig-like domain (group 3)/Abnormal spindle-like microcephaly-assoc'd, ASPM-SPD-2-Hydin
MTTRLFSAAALARMFTGTALLVSTALFAQAPQKVITLDHGGAPQSPNYQRAPGESSFANGPADFYAFSPVKAGETAPLEAVTLRFSEPTTLTKIESAGADFAVENGGSCAAGNSYGKGDSCIVLVRFTPQGPGRRLGRLNVSQTASPQPAAVGLGGYGYAPVIAFVPAATYTLSPTYSSPNGVLKNAQNLAIGGDTLYIPDPGNTLIRELDSSGALTNVTSDVGALASVTVDSFGEIWAIGASGAPYYFSSFRPWGTQLGWQNSYVADSTCTASAPCSLDTVGMDDPANISIDSDNDLFMEEKSQGALEMPVGGLLGEAFPSPELWYLTDEASYFDTTPAAFAVNPNDDLFTGFAAPPSFCSIAEEELYSAESSVPVYTHIAGGSKCGYSGDGGQATNAEISSSIGQIAFDLAGDLYFADTANQRLRRISAVTGIITTVMGTGTEGFMDATGNRSTIVPLSNPSGVAVDSQGQIYVITEAPSGATTEVVQKASAQGYLVFPGQTEGTTSAAQIATVTNVGNTDAVLTGYSFTGTYAADFSVDPTTTSCLLTPGSSLGPGETCQIGVNFTPSAAGVLDASMVFLDNTVTNSNTILLQGSGTAPEPSFVPGSISFPNTTPTQSNTIPVTVTNKGNVALEVSGITLGGANASAFSFAGNCAGGSIAPGSSCTLNVTFQPSTTGSYSAALNFTDNAPESPQSVFISGSGAKPYTSATKLVSATNPAPACSAVSFSVSVSTSDGSMATGPVTLQVGSLPLAGGTLTNGAATLTIEGLAPGLNLVTASYGGDTEHAGSMSTTLSQMVDRGSCGVVKPLLPVHDGPLPAVPVTVRP